MSTALVPVERIERAILLIRGQKVLLDSDLAALYEVPVKRLNEQVKRNGERFPEDFMFQLTNDEAAAAGALRSQTATLNARRGRHRKYLPYAFAVTLTLTLDDLGLHYDVEHKRIIKHNEERIFTHIHVADRFVFEARG
jgi:hypothetical protein